MSDRDLVFRLLRWFCPDHLEEEILGDLLQRYERDTRRNGKRWAGILLWWNVIRFLQPGIVLRNKKKSRGVMMIADHVKVSSRHLLKNRWRSFMHIGGLAVGFSSLLLIVQYVTFELSYDRFHQNHHQVFRVAYDHPEKGKSTAETFFGVGNLLRDQFAEVEAVVRFYKWPANTGAVLMAEKKVFNERNYFFAEPSFFKVFPSLLVQGDHVRCLEKPNSIVLSRRLAVKMFGTEDARGRIIIGLDKPNNPLIVTGIMMDPPPNGHFEADVVIPYDRDWLPDAKGSWLFPNNLTYILLRKDVNPVSLEMKLNLAIQKLQGSNTEVQGSKTVIQSLTDAHFSNFALGEIKANTNRDVVYGIGIAGIVILLIAWINYVNLEISAFLSRIREVSVRRIIGSTTSQLFGQFLVQYAFLCIPALLLSVLTVALLRPYFDSLTGTTWVNDPSIMTWPWLFSLTLFLVGSIVVGIYPSLFILQHSPVASMKGVVHQAGAGSVKKFLLGFQFVTSLSLIAFLFVVYHQVDFMRLADKKVALANVITVYNPTSYSIHEDSLKKEHSLAFKSKLLENPSFVNVSTSSIVPGEPVGFTYHNLTKRELNTPDDNVPYKVVFVDHDFISVYRLPLLAGRNYSPDSGEDNAHESIVINKAAALALGFSSVEAAINQEIYFMVTFDWKKYRIIGIVDDYRHESVKAPIYPTIFYLHRYVGQMTYYSIAIDKTADPQQALAYAERTWKEVWPEKSFDYFFADKHYDLQFKEESRLETLFVMFAGVAIFLACLGVVGITLAEARSRLKEISIRKVLGASIGELLGLLTRSNFAILGIATLLACPLIYLLSKKWLADYPVQIDFSIGFIVYPMVLVFVLVAASSGIQTIKAALTNPADHLKHE